MGVGERLRAVRIALGLNQEDMAVHVGLGAGSWKRLELEDRAPKGEVLTQLVDEGFSIDWLLTGRGQMRPELPAPPMGTPAIDADIMARVMDGVAGVFRQLNQTARPADLGRLAAEIYPKVADIADEAERRGALTYALRELRDRLLRAASGDTSSKLQA